MWVFVLGMGSSKMTKLPAPWQLSLTVAILATTFLLLVHLSTSLMHPILLTQYKTCHPLLTKNQHVINTIWWDTTLQLLFIMSHRTKVNCCRKSGWYHNADIIEHNALKCLQTPLSVTSGTAYMLETWNTSHTYKRSSLCQTDVLQLQHQSTSTITRPTITSQFSSLWSERENQQDATVRCILSILSQHVSGIIMPIFRRTRRVLLHVVCCAVTSGEKVDISCNVFFVG